MITDALRKFAEAINADPAPGDNIVGVLNSIVVRLGGSGDGFTTEQCIENLTAVADEINKKILIDKTITANDTYDPADDDADGYSSVTVAVV